MASVRKRTWRSGGQDKTAWVVDYFDQQGKRRLKTCRTKKEADAFRTTCSWEIRQGIHTPESTSITVGEAVAMWLEHGEAEGLEGGTLRTYAAVVRTHVLPVIGRYRLAQLSRPMLEQYRDDLLRGAVPDGRPRSRVMARKALGCLKSAIEEAKRRGRCAQNVASGVRVKARRDEDRRRREIGVDVPDKAEVRAILEAAPDRWRSLIITAVFCGLRSSELRGLTWDHVDLEQRVIRVRQRVDRWGAMGPPKTKAGERDVLMAPIVLNTLREWKLACPKGDLRLVFAGRGGGVLDHARMYRRCFGDVQRACGIVDDQGKPKYGPHAFRHFYASWLIEQGFGPKRVMGLLGHSSITMTFDLYGHLFPAGEEDHDRLAAGQAALVG